MALSHEHLGSKILAKILTRAELLFNLCYEIPCSVGKGAKECKRKFIMTPKLNLIIINT